MRYILSKIREYTFSFMYPVVLSIPISGITILFEKYIFSDWEFLKFLVIFMTIDTLISWWYHINKRSFSSKGFSRVFTKIIVYFVLLIIAHGFATHTVGGEIVEPLKWFRTFICTALLVREGISILENLNKIMPGIIPDKITKYLRDFDENGEFKSRKHNN